jgi:hypothetical protein
LIVLSSSIGILIFKVIMEEIWKTKKNLKKERWMD